MLRSCAQVARAGASSSSTTYMHTSAVLRAQVDMSRRIRREKKMALREQDLATKPSPITGTRPGEEDKWRKSELARLLVDEAEYATTPAPNIVKTTVGTINVPTTFMYGITAADADTLLNRLPELSSQRFWLLKGKPSGLAMTGIIASGIAAEAKKAAVFAKSIDLRNANADGIHFENRRRIVAAFSTPENPWNPGLQEVQAALLTYRIHNMWRHMTDPNNKKDVNSKAKLRMIVFKRARILKYLKRIDRVRYDVVLHRLGLEPRAVEGELTV